MLNKLDISAFMEDPKIDEGQKKRIQKKELKEIKKHIHVN